jgi:hypothetical protein
MIPKRTLHPIQKFIGFITFHDILHQALWSIDKVEDLMRKATVNQQPYRSFLLFSPPPLTSAEVKNAWSYASIHIRLYGVQRNRESLPLLPGECFNMLYYSEKCGDCLVANSYPFMIFFLLIRCNIQYQRGKLKMHTNV